MTDPASWDYLKLANDFKMQPLRRSELGPNHALYEEFDLDGKLVYAISITFVRAWRWSWWLRNRDGRVVAGRAFTLDGARKKAERARLGLS